LKGRAGFTSCGATQCLEKARLRSLRRARPSCSVNVTKQRLTLAFEGRFL
jgi:hypothetical protein